MKKIVIKKDNAEFKYPYILKKGILSFSVINIFGNTYLDKENEVSFKDKSIKIKGFKKNIRFNISDEECKLLKDFLNEEKLNLTEFKKRLINGTEKIFIFPKYNFFAPSSYFEKDISSSEMINKTFQIIMAKFLNDSRLKDINYLQFNSIINKKIENVDFSKFELLKENSNSNEVYISINTKEFVSMILNQ